MKELAEMFKALGDPVRLEIVKMLIGKELCVCDILTAFNVSQPTISHHLKALKYAGLVRDSRDGKWVYYSLDHGVLEQMRELLEEFAEKSVNSERCRNCACE
jgi:ArsR family transcriptional regulator, arsenate/arsenite/antimonite-responsive transcriptional repressor